MKLTGRAAQRGKYLEPKCSNAKVWRHLFGESDNRSFCVGLTDYDKPGLPLLDMCEECGAYHGNATPPEEVA